MASITYNLSPAEQAVVDRAVDYARGTRAEPLTQDERASMRAFLQRAETRLSTYQRVGGVFLNGAGLLVLLPAVTRDTVLTVVLFAIGENLDARNLVLLPWAVSLIVPLYAFLLLLRDLVEFYFAPKFVAEDPMRVTRFSLAGLSFPYDESVEAKARILAAQVTHPRYVPFILGESEEARRGATEAFNQSKSGNIAFPARLELNRRLQANMRSAEVTDADLMAVIWSTAGSLDMSLVDEVARVEASLVRHVLALRRLVLRYAKALLLFVWTTILSLVVVALVSNESSLSDRGRVGAAFVVYTGWAASSIIVVRLPRRWIDRLAPLPANRESAERIQDWDIRKFESKVTKVLVGAIIGFVMVGVVAIAMTTS